MSVFGDLRDKWEFSFKAKKTSFYHKEVIMEVSQFLMTEGGIGLMERIQRICYELRIGKMKEGCYKSGSYIAELKCMIHGDEIEVYYFVYSRKESRETDEKFIVFKLKRIQKNGGSK